MKFQDDFDSLCAEMGLKEDTTSLLIDRLPAYTEVAFVLDSDYTMTWRRGMVRDIPGWCKQGSASPAKDRRVTMLDNGSEFFVDRDTKFTYFKVTEYPK